MTTATRELVHINAERAAAGLPDNRDNQRNLYARLADVRAELGATIAKGGTAPQIMGGFKFIEWDDVAEKVGGLLNKHGVVFIPNARDASITEAGATSSGKTIWRAVVWLDFSFINVDATNEVQTISWCGVGDDTSDKAVQKAITSATKYALLKLFLLSGADDADRSDVTAAARTAPPAAGTTRTAVQSPASPAANGGRPKVISREPTGRFC